MSNQENKVKKKSGSRKIRKQRVLVLLLLILVVSVSGFQLVTTIRSKNSEDDTLYTALVFDEPLKQSLKILTIENKGNEKLFNNQNKAIEYSDLKNFKEENLDRYIAYHERYPKLMESDVMWRVNANFDYEPYANVIYLDDSSDYDVVVNKNRALSSSFVPSDLVLLEKVSNEFYLREEAALNYEALVEELEKEELSIDVSSAYKNYNTINSEYDEKDIYSVKAGHSEAQLGLAINVFDPTMSSENFEDSLTYHYLKSNVHRYGFIFRYANEDKTLLYPKDSSHLRYVGKDIAVDMYEKNINCLEEYLDKHGN